MGAESVEELREEKSKLNKTIKLLENCDALNLIRLIKNKSRKKGEKKLEEIF